MIRTASLSLIRRNSIQNPMSFNLGSVYPPSYSETSGKHMISQVELSISCENLPNMDKLSKSDPLCVLYMAGPSGQIVEYARTEIIMDNLNPKWVEKIKVDYLFETVQPLRFCIFDIDDFKTLDLSKQDFLGDLNVQLAEVLVHKGQTLKRNLNIPQNIKHKIKHKSKPTTITITAEEVMEQNLVLKFSASCDKLDKLDLFGKSDPFIRISRTREDGQIVPVWQSEVHKVTLNPHFKLAEVPAQKLCNGDLYRPLYIEVLDWERSGSHRQIGAFTASVDQLVQGGTAQYDLINEKKKRKKGKKYRNSGVFRLTSVSLYKQYSFLDYIAGGCEVSLMVAIDFTASNGDPRHCNSLHYKHGAVPSPYMRAVTSVGQVLAYYDSDNKIPVYGFGARLPPRGMVSHCFAANGNPRDPEVTGVAGVQHAYMQALNNVELYGPTIFAHILRTATQMAASSVGQHQQNYTVLLIITDGIINDMQATVDEIVKGSNLPLSIVIVGVGDADFSNMNVLDADDQPLHDTAGHKMARDIVQFVPFRDFEKAHPAMLSRAVLEEIPEQMLGYFKAHGIAPLPPRQVEETVGWGDAGTYGSSSTEAGPAGYDEVQAYGQ